MSVKMIFAGNNVNMIMSFSIKQESSNFEVIIRGNNLIIIVLLIEFNEGETNQSYVFL